MAIHFTQPSLHKQQQNNAVSAMPLLLKYRDGCVKCKVYSVVLVYELCQPVAI